MNLYSGETLRDLMTRIASIVYKIDPNEILNDGDLLYGLREKCKAKNQPLTDLAWRLLVLESCGQIAYDQLDCFFEPGDATTWNVKEEFRNYLS